MPALLSVRNLAVAFPVDGEEVSVVRDVTFSIGPGEWVGLAGESGAGKSLTGLALLRLLPPLARIIGGQIELQGRDLLAVSEAEMRGIRGKRVAMVFQEPSTSLNPVLSIGSQIAEALPADGVKSQERKQQAARLLEMVGIAAPGESLRAYPYQLSGGQRQRVMIAMALAGSPDLLVADEPTSALDVTVQAEIMDLLEELRAQLGLAILLITHDLSLMAAACDRVLVMYAGQIVERAEVRDFLKVPAHPYSQGLLASVPRIGSKSTSGRMEALQGQIPEAGKLPTGCSFHPRCPEVVEECRVSEPRLISIGATQQARCLLLADSTPPETAS